MKYAAPALALALLATPVAAQGVPFSIEQRDDINWASVPVVRAERNNTITALDVVPHGRPSPNSIGGYAWLHVCSRDLEPLVPMHCGMVAAIQGGARIGVTNHHGARPGKLEFMVGNRVVGQMTAAGRMQVGDFDTAAVLQELRSLRAEVNRLKAELDEVKSRNGR
jgi:hypothetical protein